MLWMSIVSLTPMHNMTVWFPTRLNGWLSARFVRHDMAVACPQIYGPPAVLTIQTHFGNLNYAMTARFTFILLHVFRVVTNNGHDVHATKSSKTLTPGMYSSCRCWNSRNFPAIPLLSPSSLLSSDRLGREQCFYNSQVFVSRLALFLRQPFFGRRTADGRARMIIYFVQLLLW